jgi:hypothetical protein
MQFGRLRRREFITLLGGAVAAWPLTMAESIAAQVRRQGYRCDGSLNAERAIAAQIRRRGYRCDGSLNAERDAERSKPGEAVWVLKCENATYRIRLVPNMAAQVEQL